MQRIMIVSDSHRQIGNIKKALSVEGKLDMLIHLGDFEGEDDQIRNLADCKVIFVPGNNDFFSQYDKEVELVLGRYKVLLTHGHYYYVSLDLQTIRKEAEGRGMDIVMFGHTHRPVISIEENVTLINPGSIAYPRQQDKKCTYIMMEIDDKGDAEFTLKSI